MKITTLPISFPIFRITSILHAALPRPLNVFEQTILELIQHFSSNSIYNHLSLEKIFSEILRVPNTDTLLTPCIKALQMFNMFTENPAPGPLSQCPLHQWTLSPTGEAACQAGHAMINETPQKIHYDFDPIREEILLPIIPEQLLDNPGDRKVIIDIYKDFFDQIIQKEIRKKSYAWFSRGEIIQKIQHNDIIQYWQNIRGEVSLSENGALEIDFEPNAYKQYFQNLESEYLFHTYFSDVFINNTFEDLSKSPALNYEKIANRISKLFPLHMFEEAIDISQSQIHFFRYHPSIADRLTGYPNTLIVVFEHLPPEHSQGIEWDRHSNSAIIYLDEHFLLDGCYYLNHQKDNLFISLFNLSINHHPYTLPLAYKYLSEDPLLDLTPFYKLLEEIIDYSEQLDYQLLKLFWLPVEKVWDSIQEQLKDQITDPIIRLGESKLFKDKILALQPESTHLFSAY